MPQNTADIIKTIQNDNERVVSKMIWDLIDSHERGFGGEARSIYKRYCQDRDGVPVFSRTFANYEKVHRKIPNDFVGDIVDLKTGYMGNEVVVDIDKRKVTTESEQEEKSMFLQNFAQIEDTVDMNSELVKMATITGKAFRLLYVGTDGRAHMQNVEPWETDLFYDASIHEPTMGIRYYKVTETTVRMDSVAVGTRTSNVTQTKRYRVEIYDANFVTYYRENESGIFILDVSKPAVGAYIGKGRQPHFFSGVPIIDFPNNKEDQSEVGKVLELIDAYDAILSDSTSEVEQLRMAYMWAKGAGMKISAELDKQLQQTGIWPLPADGEIGFASKNLGGASEFVQSVLGEIRRNIYSFAKSMDLSQDKGGDMRVIGWQISMLRMEMSAQVTERKFKRGYNRQYSLLTNFWRGKREIDIDPLSLRYIFTRKFPKDIDQEIDTLVKGMDVLPLEKLYSLMSFIDNPKELADQFRDEKSEMQNILKALDNMGDNTNANQPPVE